MLVRNSSVCGCTWMSMATTSAAASGTRRVYVAGRLERDCGRSRRRWRACRAERFDVAVVAVERGARGDSTAFVSAVRAARFAHLLGTPGVVVTMHPRAGDDILASWDEAAQAAAEI